MDVSKETRAVHTGAPVRPCIGFLKEVSGNSQFLETPIKGHPYVAF